MFSSIGPMELVVVLAIALVILGPKRLPHAAKSLGHGLREFKSAVGGGGGDDDDDDDDEVGAPVAVPASAGGKATSAP
jgi:sec-independent protein translocase protein TatA